MNILAPANFSPCRKYRYSLCRDVAPQFDRVLVVSGINPSVASETKPDPTSERMVSLAKRENCRWLIMVNPYPYVLTDSTELDDVSALERSGDENENRAHIRAALDAVTLSGGIVLAAWGAHRLARAEQIGWLHDLFRAAGAVCMAINKDGSPKHPLYCKKTAPLIPWKGTP